MVISMVFQVSGQVLQHRRDQSQCAITPEDTERQNGKGSIQPLPSNLSTHNISQCDVDDGNQ